MFYKRAMSIGLVLGIASLLVGVALFTLDNETISAEPSGALRQGQIAHALNRSSVQTWTHDARADWDQGQLDWLDSGTISGSLQLMQRVFGDSTTVTPRGDLAAGQQSPAIALDADGNAYAVWQDSRNGHNDIYFAHRAAVSTTWSANVKVNDDAGIAQQTAPAIAVDGSGNVYAAWVDGRNEGGADVYFAARPAGGSWGASVRVNDVSGTAPSGGSVDIALDVAGNVYALWRDERDGDDDIYFAMRPVGGSWGVNVKVNDDMGAAEQASPAIAVDPVGNVYAVWVDQRNDEGDIYFAMCPSGGNWGTNVRVNGDPGEPQTAPDIAVDDSGNAYAVWSADHKNIYFAARPAGGAWSTSARVNDDLTDTWRGAPAITVDGDRNAYTVWEDSRNLNQDLFFAYRAAISTTWSANLQANDAGWVSRPDIAIDADGNAHAVWEDERNGNPDIYFSTGAPGVGWDANTRVDDDGSGTAKQKRSDIALDSSNNAYAVWGDSRGGAYSALRPSGGDWGANVQISNNADTDDGTSPAIDVSPSGHAHAVWQAKRSGAWEWDTYAAYRPPGGPWEADIKVNDDDTSSHHFGPDITVDGDGNAYAVWMDWRNGHSDIFFATRAVASATWSADVQVNDDATTEGQSQPAVALDADSNAYAVWQDNRSGEPDIYFAYRAAVSTTWSANVRVDDDPGTSLQDGPALAVDADGNAYAVWRDQRNGNPDIYFAARPAGGTWGASVRVNDDVGTAEQSDPAIAVDTNGDVYVMWADERNGNQDLYFATRPAGGSFGANVRVDDDLGAANQRFPAIAVNSGGDVYATWRDDSYGVGHVRFARSAATPAYAMEGRYTSPELDTHVTAVTWESLTWQGAVPSGAALTFETRSRVAGGNWSAWEPVNSQIASPPGQYLQYRVAFSTTLSDTTPILEQVQIAYRSAGTPSAPRFVTPCGVTNQSTPTLRGSAVADSVVHLYVGGSEVATTTTDADGLFVSSPNLNAGRHTITACAENESGVGPASMAVNLTVSPTLAYDPINVRAGQWSGGGWLMSIPRDSNGCANPDNEWRVWPRINQRFRVEAPVSYTTSAAVTVTVGAQTITLTEVTTGAFVGVFEPFMDSGDFIIEVYADGATTTVEGGPVHVADLIDPDGYVYEIGGTISDTIPGVQVTCYYSDTHSGQWVMWDAWNYDQINPQTTLDDGYYSFYTPRGAYRVVAEKEGYPTYTSPDLVVVSTPVRHNIPFGYWKIYLPLVVRN